MYAAFFDGIVCAHICCETTHAAHITIARHYHNASLQHFNNDGTPSRCAFVCVVGCIGTGDRVRIVKPGYASHGSGKSAGRAVAVSVILRAAPTERTEQLLRVHNLTYTPRTDPRGLIKRLQDFNNSDPRADRVCAMAELSYLGGMEAQRVDKQVALDLFGASVLYSYQYLFDDRYHSTRNPYDPQYRGVCDLYNCAWNRD